MTHPTELRMDQLVAVFIQCREKKAKLKAEFAEQTAAISAVQDKIEALLLERFAALGIDSVKTPAGTAYSSVATTASLADWDTFKAFCEQQDDPFEFIERRVSKTAIEQYKAEHQDLPPGVNWSETRVVGFRRK